MKKILNTVLTVFLVIVLVLMATLSVMLIVTSMNKDGKPGDIFGYMPITIYDTKSMEPFFGQNDLVIIKEIDASQLKEGDIISFWGYVDSKRSIITHEIVGVNSLPDGTRTFETKGKNNPRSDQDEMNDTPQDYIHPDDVIGVYVTHISGIGSVMNFIKSPMGILVCMVIPLALIFLWQLYRVIRLAMTMHRETQAAKNAEMSEAEKQKVIEEYLRQQQTGSENSSTKEDASE